MAEAPRVVQLREHLDRLVPDDERLHVRYLSLFSAAVTTADESLIEQVIHRGLNWSIDRIKMSETILQSYLFLGFPRMLIAADCLNRVAHEDKADTNIASPDQAEVENWYARGEELCRIVYGGAYERLKARVTTMSPEIYRWMIFEGYGKVLSRPGMTIVEREACIVACLVMENRPVQLRSHMIGMLNVGAEGAMLEQVIDDLREAAPEGYKSAQDILETL